MPKMTEDTLPERLSDLPQHDWGRLAREMAQPSARSGSAGLASVRAPRFAQTPTRLRDVAAMGLGVATLLARSKLVDSLEWIGKKTKLVLFTRRANKVCGIDVDDERLLSKLDEASRRLKTREIVSVGQRGEKDAVLKAKEWLLSHGATADAAELFLRYPFDPRWPRGGFSQKLIQRRVLNREAGMLTARDEAIIQRAIDCAATLAEGIDLHEALLASPSAQAPGLPSSGLAASALTPGAEPPIEQSAPPRGGRKANRL